MSMADGVRILAWRAHFADVDEALRLVGVTLRAEVAPAVVARQAVVAPEPDDEPISERPAGAADGWSAESRAAVEHAADVGSKGRRPTRNVLRERPSVIASVITAVRAEPGAEYVSRIPRPADALRPRRPAVALPGRTLPSTLRSLTRVRLPSGDPDLHVAVERLARRAPIGDLPQALRLRTPPTLRVLVDVTLRRGVLAHDLQHLLDEAHRVFGVDRLEVMTYRGSPDDGCGAGPIWRWVPLAEHPSAAATLLVSAGHRGDDVEARAIGRVVRRLRARGEHVVEVVLGSRAGRTGVGPDGRWHLAD